MAIKKYTISLYNAFSTKQNMSIKKLISKLVKAENIISIETENQPQSIYCTYTVLIDEETIGVLWTLKSFGCFDMIEELTEKEELTNILASVLHNDCTATSHIKKHGEDTITFLYNSHTYTLKIE